MLSTRDLKYPPTAVGGINVPFRNISRKDLNHPPTAVGGINVPFRNISRKDLNHPPTAVGGIYDFEARASETSAQITAAVPKPI